MNITRSLEVGGWWKFGKTTVPSMTKFPFMLYSAYGFSGLMFVASWSQDNCPTVLITFTFKARRRWRGSANETSPHTCLFYRKENFPKCLQQTLCLFGQDWAMWPLLASRKASTSLLHLLCKGGKEKVLKWLLGEPVNGVCHCGFVVSFSSFSLMLCHPKRTIRFLRAEFLKLVLFSLCPLPTLTIILQSSGARCWYYINTCKIEFIKYKMHT